MKFDLTTFGETMIRISVRPGESLETAPRVDFHTGGSESNTAVALARLGMKTAWLSRLPHNPLGRRIARDIARHSVDISRVIWTLNDRAGTYYVEFAVPPRASTVTYDRKHSALSRLKPSELDWKFLLQTRVLHLTGITPALSPSCRACVTEALKKARDHHIPVSFDVNYRARLWPPKEAAKLLAPLLRQTTILIMTQDDAALFQFTGDAERVVQQIKKEFKPRLAVLTLGGKGVRAFDGKKIFTEPGLPLSENVDRLGAGDAFTAGLLFGWLHHDLPLGLKFGITASAMKIGMRGDYFLGSREEVEQVIQSRNGDVKR